MKYCNYCGVELDDNMTHCPLCGSPSSGDKAFTPEPLPGQIQDIAADIIYFDRLSGQQKRRIFWEISGIVLISGILATLVINFIISKSITWAWYDLTASLVLFANISALTFWRKRPFLLFAGSLVAGSAFLLLIDMMSSNIGWGTALGIPILVSFYALLGAVNWMTSISRQRGFNILALVFIALSLFLICIEVFISNYYLLEVRLSWSVVAGASMAVVAAIMLYLHYRLKRAIDLKRFFHI